MEKVGVRIYKNLSSTGGAAVNDNYRKVTSSKTHSSFVIWECTIASSGSL